MKGDTIDRMFDEAIELLDSTSKARNTLGNKDIPLTDEERALLEEQVCIMAKYACVLVRRIRVSIKKENAKP